MVIRARTIVTMNGAPIENGAIAIAADKISDVGSFAEVRKRNAGEIVDLGEQIVLPGLINAHCHLDYTCLRGKIPPAQSFADWIRAINAAKAKLSPDDYIASINDGFLEAKRFGTTTIANLTAFPELISQIGEPIRTWWFPELIDVREPDKTRGIVDRAVEFAKRKEHWGLAPHAPFTASPALYQRCEAAAPVLTTHLAESDEEMAMCRDHRGPLFEFLKSLGVELFESSGTTPIEYLSRICKLDERWIVVHVNAVSENDLSLLRSSKKKCHIVHCPRSHRYFQHRTFEFSKFRNLEFNICLATDSLASNDDLSLFAEMRAFQQTQPALSPLKILEMVTINPAQALRRSDDLGRIKPSFVADLIAIPAAASNSDPVEQVIAFGEPVCWAMQSGKVFAPSTI